MRTVLVTGSAGFIGFHVAQKLLARGDEVIGIDCVNDYYDVSLKEARLAKLRADAGDRFTFVRQDFSDYPALVAALDRLDRWFPGAARRCREDRKSVV